MRLIHAYFKDIQQEILREIIKSRSSILVAVAWFTDQTLFDALLDKINEGVNVELILLKDKINASNEGLDFNKFQKAGGRLFYKDTMFIHHKFCVFDESILITGSYNWTRKANEKNVENILLIQGDTNTVNAYLNEFFRLSEQNSRIRKDQNLIVPSFVAELTDTAEIIRFFQEETDAISLKSRYELEEKIILEIQKKNLIQLAIFYGLETKNEFLKSFLKGIIYYNKGQIRTQSLKYFLLASEIQPHNQHILYFIAKCQFPTYSEIVKIFGEWNETTYHIDETKTFELFSGFSRAISNSDNFFWQAYFYRALSFRDVYHHLRLKYFMRSYPDFELIRKLVKQAYEDYSTVLSHNDKNIYALYERSCIINEYFKKKSLDVINDMTKLISLAPEFDSYRPYLVKAEAYENLKMYQEAINEITTYLEFRPNSKYEFWKRGHLNIELGLLKEALHDFNVAIKINTEKNPVIDNERINSDRSSLIYKIEQKSKLNSKM